MPYLIPKEELETFYEVKKSTFHGRARYAATREEAMAFLEEVKQDYPDARHHCWAYLLGDPASPDTAAMSDDGEPAGTAGKPILNVLNHKNVGNVMLVVARYFGGIKLGAGGLVRAYSASAQLTMERLPTTLLIQHSRFEVKTDFKHEQFFRHYAQSQCGTIQSCDYAQDVIMVIALPSESGDELLAMAAGRNASVKKIAP